MSGEIVAKLLDKIREEYAPERIILFGSYAYGNPDHDSDIDLLIIKETEERPIDRRVRVSRIVYDRNLRIPFEPIVLTPQELKSRIEIGDQFIEQILRQGRTLYEA